MPGACQSEAVHGRFAAAEDKAAQLLLGLIVLTQEMNEDERTLKSSSLEQC